MMRSISASLGVPTTCATRGDIELPFAPTQLFYLTSLQCNERCTKCGHWKVDDHPRMVEPQLIVDAIRGVASAEEFCIVGGEPLVHTPRVLQIIEGIADLPIRTSIVTNGVPCTPAFVDQIRGKNVHLVFSIDTFDHDRWRWIRGRDSMERVLRNLHHVRRVLEPEQLSIQSVLAEETREDIAEVGRWCAERAIYHSIQPYVQDGFDGQWTPIHQPQAMPEQFDPAVDSVCLAAGRNLSILPDGAVLTCFQQDRIPGAERPLGHLGQTAIADILASSYTTEVLDRMRRCDLPCKVLRCNQ